jgi:hypothetical protein
VKQSDEVVAASAAISKAVAYGILRAEAHTSPVTMTSGNVKPASTKQMGV